MKPTPITRKEMYLYALGAIQTLEPVTREEMYLANLCGQNNALPLPCTRYEQYLYKMNGGNIDVPDPVTRLEMFLYRACGYEDKGTPTAITREEMYWAEYISQYVDWKTITDTLPIEFTSKGGAIHWTIYGNNTQHNYSATGTLPLTFTAKAGNAVDWTIYGNDENGTENLFNKDATDTNNGYVNPGRIANNGSVVTSPLANSNVFVSEYIEIEELTEYIFCDTFATSSFGGCFYDNEKNYISGFSYSTTNHRNIAAISPANAKYVRFSVATYIGDEQYKPMLVKGSTAPDHYIPYQKGVGEQRVDGYYVPLIISQAGQPDKTVDIYIGDSPLTEGETVSKTSTGVDIELFEGENTVSTTLYNKPETSITYTDYLGVGEYVNGQWQIPLTISSGNQSTVYTIPIEAPLTEGQSVTDTLTINTFEGENVLDTTLDNKPEMSITYKGG